MNQKVAWRNVVCGNNRCLVPADGCRQRHRISSNYLPNDTTSYPKTWVSVSRTSHQPAVCLAILYRQYKAQHKLCCTSAWRAIHN